MNEFYSDRKRVAQALITNKDSIIQLVSADTGENLTLSVEHSHITSSVERSEFAFNLMCNSNDKRHSNNML
jgi:hypothetical protein